LRYFPQVKAVTYSTSENSRINDLQDFTKGNHMKTNKNSVTAKAFIKSIGRSKPFCAAAILALFCSLHGNGVVFAADSAVAEKPKVAVSVDLPVLSAFVWRGQVVNSEAVSQPSLTVTKGGFSANVFGNVNLTGISTVDVPEVTETDFTFTYSTKIQSLAASVGLIEYLFPHQTVIDAVTGLGKAAPGTRELFVTAGLPELPGAPSIALYRDVDLVKGSYIVASSGYTTSFNEEKVSVGLSGSIGYGSAGYNTGYFGVNRAAFNDITLTAAATIKAADNFSVTPAVQYAALLDSDIKNAVRASGKDDSKVIYSLKFSYTL
jgi:hypothetical protein